MRTALSKRYDNVVAVKQRTIAGHARRLHDDSDSLSRYNEVERRHLKRSPW